MAIPVVGFPTAPVPQTVTPLSAAAFRSNELLRMPVVMSSFRFGKPSITLREKRVRSRMAQTIEKSFNA